MHIHIGTSGWHYEHWRGPSYPEDLLEINHSFYRLPSEDALQAWFVQTPAHFCFAVKASRTSLTASGYWIRLEFPAAH
jgi:uncharacterized protein YecE (DUF72 family)